MERPEPQLAANEGTMLLSFLDYQRATILLKCDGLDREQLGRTLAPSTLTLAGLLKRLWRVEDTWIKGRFLGLPEHEPWTGAPEEDPDWDFNSAVHDSPSWLRAGYHSAGARNNELIAGRALDEFSELASRSGRRWSLRWILTHLVEETARHAGHADFLRQAVDGTVGE